MRRKARLMACLHSQEMRKGLELGFHPAGAECPSSLALRPAFGILEALEGCAPCCLFRCLSDCAHCDLLSVVHPPSSGCAISSSPPFFAGVIPLAITPHVMLRVPTAWLCRLVSVVCLAFPRASIAFVLCAPHPP